MVQIIDDDRQGSPILADNMTHDPNASGIEWVEWFPLENLREPPKMTPMSYEPSAFDQWWEANKAALAGGAELDDDSSTPWWSYDEERPPMREPKFETFAAFPPGSLPQTPTPPEMLAMPWSTERPYYGEEQGPSFLDTVLGGLARLGGNPTVQAAWNTGKAIAGPVVGPILSVFDWADRTTRQAIGTTYEWAKRNPNTFLTGAESAAMGPEAYGAIVLPPSAARQEQMVQETQREQERLRDVLTGALQADPTLAERYVWAGTGAADLRKLEAGLKADWEAARVFRYSNWVNPDNESKIQALIEGRGAKDGIRLWNGELAEDRRYAPEEAADAVADPWIEAGFSAAFDVTNVFGGAIYEGAKLATRPVAAAVKLGGSLAFEGAKALPFVGDKVAWLFDTTARSKANLVYNGVYQGVRHLAETAPTLPPDDIVKAIRDPSNKVWEYAPDFVRRGVAEAAPFVSEEAAAKVLRGLQPEDAPRLAKRLGQSAYAAAAQAYRQADYKTWGAIGRGMRALDAIGDELSQYRLGRAILQAPSTLKQIWLGERPAWVWFNLTDNWVKSILHGVSPVKNIADEVAEYESKFGPLPIQAFGTFAKGVSGDVGKWSVGERAFSTPAREVARAFADGLKTNWEKLAKDRDLLTLWPGAFIKNITFEMGSAIEEGSRLRLFLNRFGTRSTEAWGRTLQTAEQVAPQTPVVSSILDELRRLRTPSVDEVRRVFDKYATPNVKVLQLGELAPQNARHLHPDMVQDLMRELEGLKAAGPVNARDVDRVFGQRMRTVVADAQRAWDARLAQELAKIKLPSSADEIVKTVLDDSLPSRVKAQAAAQLKRLDDELTAITEEIATLKATAEGGPRGIGRLYGKYADARAAGVLQELEVNGVKRAETFEEWLQRTKPNVAKAAALTTTPTKSKKWADLFGVRFFGGGYKANVLTDSGSRMPITDLHVTIEAALEEAKNLVRDPNFSVKSFGKTETFNNVRAQLEKLLKEETPRTIEQVAEAKFKLGDLEKKAKALRDARKAAKATLPAAEGHTVATLKSAWDDLNALKGRMYTKADSILNAGVAEIMDLRDAGRVSRATIEQKWETVLHAADDEWARNLALLKEARVKFAQDVEKRFGVKIDPNLIKRMNEADEEIHATMREAWKRVGIVAREAHNAPNYEAAQRIWESADTLRQAQHWQRELAEAKLRDLREAVRNALDGANLPKGVEPPGARFTPRWDLGVDEARRLRSAVFHEARQTVRDLRNWQRQVRAAAGKPLQSVVMGAQDVVNVKRMRDTVLRAWADGVSQAVDDAVTFTDDVLVDYLRTTNLEALLGHMIPFIKWPLHNIPIYLDLFAKHAWIPSKVAMYREAQLRANENLPSRMRFTIPAPFNDTLAKVLGLRDGSLVQFDPLQYLSIFQQAPGMSYYEQRELAEAQDQGPLRTLLELGEQVGFGLWPWWDYLAGASGVLGEDFYPRNLYPWSVAIEYLTSQVGVTLPREYMGQTAQVGVNPDAVFREKLGELLTKLGVENVAFVPDMYMNWLVGREVRAQTIAGERQDVQQAYRDVLRQQFVATVLGHGTSMYVKTVTPQELGERALRHERDSIVSRGPQVGPEYRQAWSDWYAAHPEMQAVQRVYDEMPWVQTKDELARAEEKVRLERLQSEYWDKRRVINAKYDEELNAYLREHPFDKAGMREVQNRRFTDLDALKDEYKDIPIELSTWGRTEQELEDRAMDNVLRQVIDQFEPNLEDFRLPDGTFDYDEYKKSQEWFLTHAADVALKLPQVQTSMGRAMAQYDLTREQAEAMYRRYFEPGDIWEYRRRNDPVQVALLYTYQKGWVDVANERYQNEVKPLLDKLEAQYAGDSATLAKKKREVMDKFFADFGPVPATEVEAMVKALYPDRWTDVELMEATRGLTLPGIQEIWDMNKTRKERLISRIWDEYNELPALNRKDVRALLGDMFAQQFVDKNTRNYDALSEEVLGEWLTKIEVARGKSPTDWTQWPSGKQTEEAEAPTTGAEGPAEKVVWELVPAEFRKRGGETAPDFLASAADPAALVEAWLKTGPVQRNAIELVHPGMAEAMKTLAQSFSPGMGGEAREKFNGRVREYAGVAKDTEPATVDAKKVIPQLATESAGHVGAALEEGDIIGPEGWRFHTPEEAADYDRALGLNRKFFGALEAGDQATADAIREDPSWRRWFGSTPKAIFWELYRQVPPGWRGDPVTENGVVSAILDKGVRAYMPDKAYAEAIEFMRDRLAQMEDIGDPAEWPQVKKEIAEYMALKNAGRLEEAREYWKSHPLLTKYYSKPDQTKKSSGGGGGGGGGHGGSAPAAGYVLWTKLAGDAGATLPFLMGEVAAYVNSGRALSPHAKQVLRDLFAKYGKGRSFEDFLRWMLTAHAQYGGGRGGGNEEVAAPRAPNLLRQAQQLPALSGTRWQIRR